MKNRIIFHIGVPKSGTTTLQLGVFPAHPGLRFLGKPYYDEDFGYEGSLATANLIDSLWKEDGLKYNPVLAKERFDAGILPRTGATWTTVLSEEGLSQASAGDRLLTAKRIFNICEDVDCKILITIREQKSALFSAWQWCLSRGLISLSFDSWIRYCNSYSTYIGTKDDYPLRQYEYSQLVSSYVELFGADRVLVLPLELMAEDKTQYFTALEKFACVCPFWSTPECPSIEIQNASVDWYGIQYQRLIKLVRSWMSPGNDFTHRRSEALETEGFHGAVMKLISHFDISVPAMSSETSDWLDSYFAEDNRRLNALLDYDLQKFGYVLAGPNAVV